MEAHVIDRHSVHRRLRRREPREDVEGPGPYSGVEIGLAEQSADVAVEVMLAGGSAVVAMIVNHARIQVIAVRATSGPVIAAPVVRAPVRMAVPISGSGHSVFMIFVAVMGVRVPAVRSMLASGCAVMVAMEGRRVVVVARRARVAVPAAHLVHREPRTGQCVVGMIDALDSRDGKEPGPLEGRDERRLELGPGVEHCRREHVAGNPTDRIKLDVHG